MITEVTSKKLPVLAFDFLALCFVYFIPALSHLTAIPFNLIEPFRIMVLVSLVVMNNQNNALVLSVTLPLFSFVIASHPLFAKSLLISLEMLCNVLVYSYMSKRINKPFWVLLMSIFISKAAYYLLKYSFLLMGVLSGTLV